MSSFCQLCGNVGFRDGDDGFLYCNRCNSQVDDYIETEIDLEDIFNGEQAIYSSKNARRPSRDEMRQSQLERVPEGVGDYGVIDAGPDNGSTQPADFASTPSNLSYDDFLSEIRSRYVRGFQILIQLQVKALVEKFNVSPLIVGLVGPIWLRLLAITRIVADEWADEAIEESESHIQDEAMDFQPRFKHRTEPHSMFGQRAVMIWHRYLRRTLPLSYSLAISFLVCHLSRELVLPTDIINWVVEGKLPYIAAFIEIEKQLGYPSSACPISASCMFRPTKIISLQQLEASAAYIAQKACRIYEWSVPPGLFISTNKARLPTRVCVMAILIVTIRILYDINGSGKWEESLSTSSSSCSPKGNVNKPVNSAFENASDDEDFELDIISLLKMLGTKYSKIKDPHACSRDLSSYLKYCKEVIFTGSGPSYEDHDEGNITQEFWGFYQNESLKQPRDEKMCTQAWDLGGNIFTASNNVTRKSNDLESTECNSIGSQDASESAMNQTGGPQTSIEAVRDEAIRQLKLDMDENRFSYIPPRRQMKKMGYVYYSRKKMEGSYEYACHADYYILLRACARVAQIDLRILHLGVMMFERRLKQLEEKMNQFYHVKIPSKNCSSPANEVEQNYMDES
ncbi:OLC1v1031882C3 [Oldenlandia corymbosa var. corymbosa]|uniref:OLC1v1031882C3 n=1 Tax=Oldenlandia corymbosa var. corymbosa TaxID=529605 RepID=A0AAV1CL53_OLDCO|nr:OLC1v1031882C3 [Oldenlandia corymbosa var. corymbosa]